MTASNQTPVRSDTANVGSWTGTVSCDWHDSTALCTTANGSMHPRADVRPRLRSVTQPSAAPRKTAVHARFATERFPKKIETSKNRRNCSSHKLGTDRADPPGVLRPSRGEVSVFAGKAYQPRTGRAQAVGQDVQSKGKPASRLTSRIENMDSIDVTPGNVRSTSRMNTP